MQVTLDKNFEKAVSDDQMLASAEFTGAFCFTKGVQAGSGKNSISSSMFAIAVPSPYKRTMPFMLPVTSTLDSFSPIGV